MLFTKEKRCVVTLQIGDGYDELGRLTLPPMKEYASKIGVDFHLIQSKKILPDATDWKHVCWEKYQIAELFTEYDAVCFLDLDCMVFPDCPDIFKYHPEGFVATKSEQALEGITWFAWFYTDFKWPQYQINSGVMLFRKSHVGIFELPTPFPPSLEFTVSEQHWWALNAQILDLPITPIYWRFHVVRDWEQKKPWIYHAVRKQQMENKVETMKKILHRSYSGNTSAFQADAGSSILPRCSLGVRDC